MSDSILLGILYFQKVVRNVLYTDKVFLGMLGPQWLDKSSKRQAWAEQERFLENWPHLRMTASIQMEWSV